MRGGGGELEAFDETREAHWTLDALAAAARDRAIVVSRSQIRRILLHEGVRWRNIPGLGRRAKTHSSPERARVVEL